ncbi:MAG TPA: biotin/lipoyl-binding protein, partial [Anaeromyxobacteraceae bacterium]
MTSPIHAHGSTAHALPPDAPATAPHPVAAPAPAPEPSGRKRLLVRGGIAAAAALALLFGLHLFLTRGEETTDDAQIEADVVPVAPRVAGAVLRVAVQDNQQVRKGDLLFELDAADYAARAQQAEAELATAEAQAMAAEAQVQVVEASARGGFAGARAAVSSSAAAL